MRNVGMLIFVSMMLWGGNRTSIPPIAPDINSDHQAQLNISYIYYYILNIS